MAMTMLAGSSVCITPFARSHPAQPLARRAIVCRADSQDGASRPAQQAQLLGVGLVAAALLSASAADAGVVLEKYNTKKLFQVDPAAKVAQAAAKPAEAAKKAASGGLPALPSFSLPQPKLDVGTIALPATIVALGGLAVVGAIVDPGFSRLFENGLIKDSNQYAGYEGALGAMRDGGNSAVAGTKKLAAKGTKKVKVAAKKGGFGGLFSKK